MLAAGSPTGFTTFASRSKAEIAQSRDVRSGRLGGQWLFAVGFFDGRSLMDANLDSISPSDELPIFVSI